MNNHRPQLAAYISKRMLYTLTRIHHALIVNRTADNANIVKAGNTRALAAQMPIAAKSVASKPLGIANQVLVEIAVERSRC
jgi:hypothetical protein